MTAVLEPQAVQQQPLPPNQISKADCQRQSVTPVRGLRSVIGGTWTSNLNLGNFTQHIFNAGDHFIEGILHNGEPKAIQLVNTYMVKLFQKLDRIMTTTAFLLVLILMRKFCQPQQVWRKEGQ